MIATSEPVRAQPVCETVNGIVGVGQGYNIGDDFPINDAGLVAHVSYSTTSGQWFFHVSNGGGAVHYGPFTGFNLRTLDLNNTGGLLWSEYSPHTIHLTRGAVTETVVTTGTRFVYFGDAVMNDDDEVAFTAREILPGGAWTDPRVFVTRVGEEPTWIPLPPGYTLSFTDVFRPGIDNTGTVAIPARRIADGAYVVLAGDATSGLSEIVSDDHGAPFIWVYAVSMQRVPDGGPAVSFTGATTGPNKLYSFARGALDVVVEPVPGSIDQFIHGVANADGDFAAVVVGADHKSTLLHGRVPLDLPGDLAGIDFGDVYPFDPPNTVKDVRGLRMNRHGQMSAGVAFGVPDTGGGSYIAAQFRSDPPGTTECRPVLPDPCDPPSPRLFCFDGVRFPRRPIAVGVVDSGRWVDPPLARSYEYTMRGDAHFTAITDFPTGFDAEFAVIADGVPVPGTFGAGDVLEFAPPGVTRFVVTGIQPGADSSRSDAFPLRIDTDEEIVSFDVRAIVDQEEIGISAKSLKLSDKRATSGKASLAFTVKDALVVKGAATDLADVAASLTVAYEGGAVSGTFDVPRGAVTDKIGWTANTSVLAKYGNKTAPLGPTPVKAITLKPFKSAKLVAAGAPFDVVAAGPPPGRVLTAFCVENGRDAICHCTAFSGCVHKLQSGGARLDCKSGVPDPSCGALP